MSVEAMGEAASVREFTTPRGRGLSFTRLGFGGAAIGNMHRALAESEVRATLEAAWDGGLRYFDTAPLYGHGLSERRIGRFLAGRPREAFLLSTKVGRLLEPCAPGEEASGIYKLTPQLKVRFDYTADGVRGSLDASLERLGLDRVDILYVHDLEARAHGAAFEAHWAALADGGWRALDNLRASGAIAAIGLGTNDAAACRRLLAQFDPDLFLLAGRYTLLEQGPLADLLPDCEARGVGLVVGGPFNSGVLARPDGCYDYGAAPPEVLARAAALARICEGFGVRLPAAALRFAEAHPAVVSVIPGAQTAGEARDNVGLMDAPIPPGLWEALKAEGLVDRAAPTPRERLAAPC